MTLRVHIEPELLQWAMARAKIEPEALVGKFPKLESWLTGDLDPTLKQAEKFANTTRTPFGYLMYKEPPKESVPIPDLRTIRDAGVARPSPDLLETIFICQQRQEWFANFAKLHGHGALSFVGSTNVGADVVATAQEMRSTLGMGLEQRRHFATWTEALRQLISQADEAGVLVMVSGVVRNNNKRKLDPQEFRGFALADPVAPVVFINGSDSKSAQMFTLAHELAHLWLGETALSDVDPKNQTDDAVEKWCNRVAAEMLVPLKALRERYDPRENLGQQIARLAKEFKVSTLVVLRRILDAGFVTRTEYWRAYDAELTRIENVKKGSGGNFYLTQGARLGKRFARSVVVSTLEGETLHRDAFRLLGLSKVKTFHELGRSLGVG